jgi:hypothetical protein
MPTPPKSAASEKMILEYFSPMASVTIEKFSPIYDGNCSTFDFSKNATS